ncbi:hypothetical protein XA68_12629 [Ophiocordyceps unilateralis]|uniref:Transmembrane protein n=1 Tax=Ophiocordyceps unilateralis TaxID=268505 RepID=A0A2A9PEC1_OPHUN|nr:hypothetical protein XA68_12629 [Ophiocordyceps unilateralis]
MYAVNVRPSTVQHPWLLLATTSIRIIARLLNPLRTVLALSPADRARWRRVSSLSAFQSERPSQQAPPAPPSVSRSSTLVLRLSRGSLERGDSRVGAVAVSPTLSFFFVLLYHHFFLFFPAPCSPVASLQSISSPDKPWSVHPDSARHWLSDERQTSNSSRAEKPSELGHAFLWPCLFMRLWLGANPHER